MQDQVTQVNLESMAKQRAAGWLTVLSKTCHAANINWWKNIETGEPIQRNVGEVLMLCVSELAEAMEGHRKGLPDDKLPHRSMFEVELADCLIRIFDLTGGMGLDIGAAFVEKMAYNAQRADHKIEHRKAEGGKKY
jgi:NTP pyrophosphatase (non-canonical NTP hydrolase)